MVASTLWPLITLIVQKNQEGTAFGIAQAVQNLGLALISMLAGSIVDEYGYECLEIFFAGWMTLAMLLTVWVWILDYKGNGVLNMTPAQRQEFLDEQKKALLQKSSSAPNYGAMQDVA